ncbi:HET-domain-containing protein [Cucurbitaria berberidis CBS 394.84]|uniref:HET-domain-containing protein n=1 Tax=Cucurbitaria berberidis CBS 394.84 TaxID=1168544 RepID=A0A9P4L8P5_9PLEO|nr:HET-domain-containing protein [Cucurbitaria berberidis CBS 394.84]KAF1845557.1 HET-domain-containing protein [Cucurbitaria berberidis CBS 394.84]
MRLLKIEDDGKLSLTKDLIGDDDIVPAYAILSHTWQEDQEVTFDDFINDAGKSKTGYDKLRFCAQQAERDGLRYFWVDTCCINKVNAVELQDAINSMFRWYRDATRCYVFLSDVSATKREANSASFIFTWEPAFRRSRWFTRGWTLQELLAPRNVTFFSREGKQLGDREKLKQLINEITGMPIPAVLGVSLDDFSVDERLSWTERRNTTRKEDKAYSLLGIFGIYLPLIYGEGQENAFRRLRKGIEEHLAESSQQRPPPPLTDGVHKSAHKTSYYIPFPKNRYFVGRTNELDVLKQSLLEGQDCQKMSIVGLGGTGKTQIALQIAYMFKETLSGCSIFWMPAVSMETFEQACKEIAVSLHLVQAGDGDEDAKELVKEHLSAEQAGRWLLVLDNADDRDIVFGTGQSRGIVDYLPESERGTTLFTTRTQGVAVSLTRGDVLELGSMTLPDATHFLEKSLIKKDLICDTAATTELLGELTCLPLAIAQAAAYLNLNRTSITKYLRLLKSTEQDTVGLMSKEFRDNTRYRGSANAVATTWIVSFTQLRERDTEAAKLLEFMSCIEWKAIPRSLLPTVRPKERMDEAIGTLCGYSFVSRREDDSLEGAEGEEEWYDLHRLVHLATRIWTNKHGDAAGVTGEVIKHVAKVFPHGAWANRAVWRAYMPHALRLLDTKQGSNVKEKAELICRVGRCLTTDGRIGEAVKWLEESCSLRSELDEDDPYRLKSQHALASAYEADGQVKKAITILEIVVAVKEKVLDKENPNLLASQHELASAYEADGQVKKAVALLEYVVDIKARTLRADHPSRLISIEVLEEMCAELKVDSASV